MDSSWVSLLTLPSIRTNIVKRVAWIVLALWLAVAASAGAQGRRDSLRQAARTPGPMAVVTWTFDAWIQDDQLYFRGAGRPAAEPFQRIRLPGPGQRIAAAADRLYVWLAGSRLLEFSAGADGLAGPRDLPVDDPVALAALQPAPQTMHSQRLDRAEVVISPARLLVTNSESGTVGSISGDSVTAIDTSTNQVISTLNLNPGDSPYDIAVLPDNTQAFTANYGCQTCIDRGVSVFDPSQMTVLKRLASALPTVVVLSPDGTRLYVGDDAILRTFDTATGNQIAAVDLLVTIRSIVLPSTGQTLYVIGSDDRPADIISVVNAASPGTLGTRYTFPAGSVCGAAAVAPGDQRLYVSCSNPPTIYGVNILSDGTLSVGSTIATTRTFSLAFSPDGKKLYAPHYDSATVEVLDTTSGSRLNLIPVQRGPVTIVVNRAGTRGYTANYDANTVSVLDLTTDSVVANVAVGPSPVGLALTATSVTVAAAPAQLSFAATTGQANPAPQNLTLTLEGGSATWGATVATVTGGNWLSLSAVTGTFPATLQVSVNLASLPPGVYVGTITVSPSVAGSTPVAIAVSLLLSAASGGPSVSAGGIVNAASFAANTPVAAASLVSLFGTNLGPATGVLATGLPLPTLLSNVKVRVNGILAPLIYVSATQINLQVPVELAGQTTVQVVAQNGDLPSPPVSLSLVAAAPGVFTASVGGRTQGAVLNKDNTLNTPANPARLGDIIQIYATGQGAVSNAPASGSPAPSSPLATTAVNPVVLIGGRQADIAFSGLAPGFVGLWQINAVVPATIPAGDAVSVQIVHGGVASNTATIAVTAIPPP